MSVLLQTLQLPAAEQQRYVDYLRKHIFGQAPLSPDFQELQVCHIAALQSDIGDVSGL